jgi:2'-5' RNA ligase
MDAGGLFRNYAVDIVLLPPPEVMDAAIQINRMLIEMTGDDAIRLDMAQQIPHVSLAMGCIPGRALSELHVPLEQLAKRLLPMEIGIEGAVTVVKEDSLFVLHRSVMAQLAGISKEKCTPASFVRDEGEEELTPFTLGYVPEYRENAGFERYSPHITLGNGDVTEIDNLPVLPEKATFSTLAVCHLGNHCTCRSVLWSSPAGGKTI